MTAKDEFTVIARIVRPQGRHGEVLAEILTDFPEKFAERKQLWLADGGNSAPRKHVLDNHWFHKGRVVLKLAGIDSISDAETLNGQLVQIPSKARSPLEGGAIYVSDLVGSEVIDVARSPAVKIGVVADVQQDGSAAPILLVRASQNDEEYEIPFAQEYLIRFDGQKKLLEMKLPEGLLEVNSPLSSEEKRDRK